MSIRGVKVEIFRNGKWYMPKRWCKGMENPTACLRDLMIRNELWDYDFDKKAGEFYNWCNGKATGVVL